MIQTFHYKRVTRTTLPALSELLINLPDADVISLTTPESVNGGDVPVGYKKVTLVHNGHRYNIVVLRQNPVSTQYIIEVSVSPHYHNHDSQLLYDFNQFADALSA